MDVLGCKPHSQRVRVALAGLGFFSRFHADAWMRLAPEHTLVAAADPRPEARSRFAERQPSPVLYEDVEAMLEAERPDVLDIVTRPDTHGALARAAFARGVHAISQKPLAPSWEECLDLVEAAGRSRVRLLVHDNWRFQPWFTEAARLLGTGAIGRPYQAYLRVRLGDGRGDRPFAAQPYFTEMPRFLFYESQIHQIDLIRYLFGEITAVRALAARVRTGIAGEDLATALFQTATGVVAVLDANRWAESPPLNPAGGATRIEGTEGWLRVTPAGVVFVKRIGIEERVAYRPAPIDRVGYRGDSAYHTIAHLAKALQSGAESPLDGSRYLGTMRAVFDCYADWQRAN